MQSVKHNKKFAVRTLHDLTKKFNIQNNENIQWEWKEIILGQLAWGNKNRVKTTLACTLILPLNINFLEKEKFNIENRI